MPSALVIANYGMGNLNSVASAFGELGIECTISNDPKVFEAAKGIVLPGVGAFPAAMENIRKLKMDEALEKQILENKKPFLGICLGMQLLAKDSTELGISKGLGWIEGRVTRIEPHKSVRIPHVGWNKTDFKASQVEIFEKIPQGAHFYFDHSYHLQCAPDLISATCDYGCEIVAAIQKDNIFAVQFHPEKSQRNGLKLLRNFINSVAAYQG